MWETTFPRNSHAGLGRDFTKMFHTREYVRFVKWPTQSGVAISRKCCFPHGPECLFGLPKSSFGEHKSATFCSPQWLKRASFPCRVQRHRAVPGLVFQAVLKGVEPCRVKGRRTRSCEMGVAPGSVKMHRVVPDLVKGRR